LFVFGLIALFSSDDHITLVGRTLQVQQQWGIPLIATSVATIFVEYVQYSAPLGRDAQLATRSRLRAADEAARERDRATEARERQREGFNRLDQAALLCGRFQLNPAPANRARFRFFLILIPDVRPADPQGDG
jgi:hypothetical protein